MEELDRAVTQQRRASYRRHAIAVTLLAAAVIFVLSRLVRQQRAERVPPRVQSERLIDGRLSGFAWAPLRPRRKAFRGVAQTRGREKVSADSRRAFAIAQLLAGDSREALDNLIPTATESNTAATWSDVAAAYLSAADQYAVADLFGSALAACDHALTIDPQRPEPLFNRAVVLERLGLRDDAREAWQRYLGADVGSDWAREARLRLRRLELAPSFIEQLDRAYDHYSEDKAALRDLVRRDPQAARGYGWMEVLGRWGEAVARGDSEDAERHLRVARSLGDSVTAVNGDEMLARVVAAITNAGAMSRRELARSHVEYRDAIMAFRRNRPVDAERMLRRAAAAFARSGSPMELNASYFAANAAFEAGHHDDAERSLTTLLRRAPRQFPAYRAQLRWQLGVGHTSRASWGTAIELLQEAASEFDRLGEIENAAAVRRVLALAFDRIGDRAAAWNVRMMALRGTGSRTSLPLAKVVASMAQAAVLREDWSVAESFLTLHAAIARRLHDDVQLTDALLKRATVRQRLARMESARNDASAAAEAADRIEDPAYRAWAEAARMRTRAVLSSAPEEAEKLLTEAIEFTAAHSDRMFLPALLLERGRARRQTGNFSGAKTDLEDGIALLERHRDSLPVGEERWGAFHAAEELFDEAIDLALSAGDPAMAFAISEQNRARSLLDVFSSAPVAAAAPTNATIVEYAVLPTRLVIFVMKSSQVQTVTVEVERAELMREINLFLRAVRSDDPNWKNAARALHCRLVEPIANELHENAIIFVPDAATATVPFGALVDSNNEFLVEHYNIVIAPSARAYLLMAERRRRAHPVTSVLIVSNPDGDGEQPRLRFAEREGERVARLYAHARRLSDDAAELDEFRNYANEADAIHFAGHAIGDDRGWEPASILMRKGGTLRRIGVAEIASLRLRRTSVVVLAGCGTARGERRAAEGVISVAYGFLMAGAPSVIATLWPINDEASADLYPRLHERLANGNAPTEALRAVQLESIRRGDVPPSLWAALQAIGS